MAPLLPRRTSVDTDDCDPQLVRIADASADGVFSALSSQTARALLTELYRQPAPFSEAAERVDTTLQNATYHLRRLEEAGLIETVDTWYSSCGQEMDVYAPSCNPLLLIAADDDSTQRLDDR